jgi:transcriptional regulator with XRE-family HTH domain
MKNLKENPHADIGDRLGRVRRAWGYSQSEMATLPGVSVGAYNSWETGYGRLSLSGARCIKAKLGISLDYLYDGEISTLSPNQHKALTGQD